MDLEIRHLRLIMAITDEGSVTRASERLHLTQSALSCQLRDAEQRLGTSLFERLGKRMVLTPAGERLLASARVVLTELQTAERDLRTMGPAASKPVRIATECYTCYTWLPPVLQRLQERVPGAEVSIEAEYTRKPLPALLHGDLDVAIVTQGPADRRIQRTPLFSDELVAVLPAGHRLAKRRWLEARDLVPEHVATYDAPRDHLSVFTDVMDPAGLAPARHTRMQLTEAMLELVRAGLAIAVMPHWIVSGNAALSNVRLVRLTRRGIQRDWSAATLRGRSLPRHVAAFVEVLAELCRERAPKRL